MKLDLKTIGFIPILFLLCGIASAVTIPSNIQINLTNVNLTVDNLTFDGVIIDNDTVSFNQSNTWSNITVVPDSQINMTISKWNVTGDYHKSWSKIGEATVAYTISGLPTHKYVNVLDGGNSIQLISGALGLVTFSSSGSGTYYLSVGGASSLDGKIDENKEYANEMWMSGVSMIALLAMVMMVCLTIVALKHGIDYKLLVNTSIALMIIMAVIYFGYGILTYMGELI